MRQATSTPSSACMRADTTGPVLFRKPQAEASAETGTLSLTMVKERGPMQLETTLMTTPATVSSTKESGSPVCRQRYPSTSVSRSAASSRNTLRECTTLSDSQGKTMRKGSGVSDMMDMLSPAISLDSPLACMR